MTQKIGLALKMMSLGASIALLSGCASIVDGTTQSVLLDTTPVKGAHCTLENNKGAWSVPYTPGSISIHRSYEALHITCNKRGYDTAAKQVDSSTKGMAFGNVVLGGVIGGGVDAADGAAYDYPSQINVPMHATTKNSTRMKVVKVTPLKTPPTAKQPTSKPMKVVVQNG